MPNLGISFPVAYNAYQIFNTCMWIDNTTKVVLNFFYNPKVEKTGRKQICRTQNSVWCEEHRIVHKW